MPTVVEIDLQEHRAQAIDILSDAGVVYSRAPGHRFIVSDRAPELLRTRGVHFRILGKEKPKNERK